MEILVLQKNHCGLPGTACSVRPSFFQAVHRASCPRKGWPDVQTVCPFDVAGVLGHLGRLHLIGKYNWSLLDDYLKDFSMILISLRVLKGWLGKKG